MDSKQLMRASKFISLVLRHKPDVAGLSLDPEGWADIGALLKGMQAAGHAISRGELSKIVADDEKGRYVISADGQKVRAAQGHSIAVELGLEAQQPPELLYHGTVADALDGIRKTGIEKRKRTHVHLSPDIETATTVGKRRGAPVILIIRARSLHDAGHPFFRAENGVWLTDHVPVDAIEWHDTIFIGAKK